MAFLCQGVTQELDIFYVRTAAGEVRQASCSTDFFICSKISVDLPSLHCTGNLRQYFSYCLCNFLIKRAQAVSILITNVVLGLSLMQELAKTRTRYQNLLLVDLVHAPFLVRVQLIDDTYTRTAAGEVRQASFLCFPYQRFHPTFSFDPIYVCYT